MGVGRIFVSDVTVRFVDGDLVFVVWVLGGWECSFVVLNWEKVTELELVEGKLRNGGIAVDNSLVTLSSNIGAVAGFVDNLVLLIAFWEVWLMLVLLLWKLGNLWLFSVIVDVHWLWLWRLLFVKLVVLWVVDWVTIDWLLWWRVEFIRLEKFTEFGVSVFVDNIDICVLVLWNVWQELWESPGDWSSNEWLWGLEVDLGATGVVEVVVPVPWCWSECIWVNVCIFIIWVILEVGVVNLAFDDWLFDDLNGLCWVVSCDLFDDSVDWLVVGWVVVSLLDVDGTDGAK